MIALEILLALIVALLIAALLVGPGRRRAPGPLSGFVFMFILLFAIVWAAGVWVAPSGPTLWGVSWLMFLAAGLVLALLFAALLRPATPGEAAAVEPPPAGEMATAFGLFFWLLLIVLLGVLLAHYIWRVPEVPAPPATLPVFDLIL